MDLAGWKRKRKAQEAKRVTGGWRRDDDGFPRGTA